MGLEPERKFLLKDDSWKESVVGSVKIVQRYLLRDKERTERIRIEDGERGFLTIKLPAPPGSIETPEFEYPIPLQDAQVLMKSCLPGVVEKTRHYVPFAGKTWEVDVFEGDNEGLVVAEIELKHGYEAFEKPAWAGEEVTFISCYKNAALTIRPYKTWNAPGGNKPASLCP